MAAVTKMAAMALLKPPQPPILISTKPESVNPHRLMELYASCNYSCYRFPVADDAGRVEPVEPLKLSVALSHSPVMVSAFSRPEELLTVHSRRSFGGGWIGKMGLSSPKDGLLIGFGRAVSDLGLTASIHDVVVHPALQGRGIGRKIVERIVWVLTNKFGIYDIAALCTDRQRACGFGEDILESTTMMYTRSASVSSTLRDRPHQTVSAGRRILLIPPPRELAM